MVFKVFIAVASLFMLVGRSVSSTHSIDSVKTVYNMRNRLPTHTSTTTTATVTAVSTSYFLGNSLSESSHVNITGKGEARGDEMAKKATHSHYSVSDVNHELREKKERKLLDEEEGNLKPLNGNLVSEWRDGKRNGYMQDSVHKFVTAKGKLTSAVAVKASIGPSLNALYELYSLISYIAAASEGQSENKSKGSGSVHLNVLYPLYSLVAYVMDADNIDGIKTGGSREKYGGTTLEVGRSSALHHERETDARLDETSSDSSKWTYHIFIALGVVTVVAMMLVVAACLIRYCRRAKMDSGVAPRPVVRGVCSPAT